MIIKKKKFIPKPEIKPPEPKSTEQGEPVQAETAREQAPLTQEEPDIFEGFNFQEIDFTQRTERRRGDRRRGYRRVDERNFISRAQQEAISIKEEALKEGYEAGLTQARQNILELKQALEEFYSFKEQMYEKVSSDILDIALAAAQKIIKKEVSQDKTILSNIVNDALTNIAKGENKIILKVSPLDVEYAKDLVPELLSTGQTEAKIYVTADKTVDEGGVIIETSNGILDANLSTQLNVIKEAFGKIAPNEPEKTYEEEET